MSHGNFSMFLLFSALPSLLSEGTGAGAMRHVGALRVIVAALRVRGSLAERPFFGNI